MDAETGGVYLGNSFFSGLPENALEGSIACDGYLFRCKKTLNQIAATYFDFVRDEEKLLFDV